MKSLARSYIWWPAITKNIEQLAKGCEACKLNGKNPPKATPHPWIEAQTPWERIHIDFCDYDNKKWLIVVDAYSKWPDVVNMNKSTTSACTIRELRKLFSVYGLAKTVVSDNGPQLVSDEIEQFFTDNGIKHIRIPAYKAQCNGLAEKMVDSFKSAMTKMRLKCNDVMKNVSSWLLTYRNTPHSITKEAPAILMFGRRTRTLFSCLYPTKITQKVPDADQVNLRQYSVGDQVLFKNVHRGIWEPGIVHDKEGNKVYIIKELKGSLTRKHIDQLKDGIVESIRPCISASDFSNKSNQFVEKPVSTNIESNSRTSGTSTVVEPELGGGLMSVICRSNRQKNCAIDMSPTKTLKGILHHKRGHWPYYSLYG